MVAAWINQQVENAQEQGGLFCNNLVNIYCLQDTHFHHPYIWQHFVKVEVKVKANVDRVVTLSRNRPPCSWTFSISWFFHAATSSIRDTVHHPYISTCF